MAIKCVKYYLLENNVFSKELSLEWIFECELINEKSFLFTHLFTDKI